jgi:hypothetical protein
VVLGVSGFAVAQDRLNDKEGQSAQPRNSTQQTQQRQTTDKQPLTTNPNAGQQSGTGSTQSSGGSTQAQQPSTGTNAQSTGQNAQGGTGQSNSGTSQQPSSGQSNQPANNQPPSAQLNTTNQPSSAQSNTTNQPSSAQSNTTNQPSTASGNQQRQPSTAQQPAQTNQNTAQQHQSGQTNVRLSASLQSNERTRLHAEIGRLNVRPVNNVNFSVSVGTVVPRSVTLEPLPAPFVEIIPQYRGYKFFVVRDEVVIVEPNSFRIVDVIERSGSGSRAHATTSDRKLNLSSQQRDVIRKHYSSKKPVTTGAATRSEKIVVGEEVPESVTIETFPEDIYREVPAVRNYRYIHGDRGLYIVEPQSRRVIEELD